jgi:hypothetical protein
MHVLRLFLTLTSVPWMCRGTTTDSCAYPPSTTALPPIRPHSCRSLPHDTYCESDFLASTHEPLAIQTAVQIP